MEYVKVPWSEIPISRLGHGCELLGGADWGTVDLDDAISAVRAAVDAGVTVFDTADAYGLGRSEALLRDALGDQIAEVVVVTKGGVAWREDGGGRATTYRDVSARHLRRAVEGSLRRLGMERIPLYLAHWPDGVHPVEDVVDTLQSLHSDGLIGAYGLSNFSADDLTRPGILERVSAIEVEHSLVAPNRQLIDLAAGDGRAAVLYGVLGQGLLTGKYRAGAAFPRTDRRHRLSRFAGEDESRSELLEELRLVADELGLSAGQVAIRWALGSSDHSCAVVGARDPQQLAQNVASIGTIPAAALGRLTAAAENYISRRPYGQP